MTNIIYDKDFPKYLLGRENKGEKFITVYSEDISRNSCIGGEYSKILADNLDLLARSKFEVIYFSSETGNGEINLDRFNYSDVKIIIFEILPIFNDFTRSDIKIVFDPKFVEQKQIKCKEYHNIKCVDDAHLIICKIYNSK